MNALPNAVYAYWIILFVYKCNPMSPIPTLLEVNAPNQKMKDCISMPLSEIRCICGYGWIKSVWKIMSFPCSNECICSALCLIEKKGSNISWFWCSVGDHKWHLSMPQIMKQAFVHGAPACHRQFIFSDKTWQKSGASILSFDSSSPQIHHVNRTLYLHCGSVWEGLLNATCRGK